MQPAYTDDLAVMLKDVDAFLPSEMETRSFFAALTPDLWQAAEIFAGLGPRCVVLKLGARGQFVYDAANRRRWHVPAYPVKVVDVTGAGDAYCGGFLAGLVEGRPVAECAAMGTVAASYVVEARGALATRRPEPAERDARLADVLARIEPSGT
jgi:ribokinase